MYKFLQEKIAHTHFDSKKIINLLSVFIIFGEAVSLCYTIPFFEIRVSYFLIFLTMVILMAITRKIYFSKSFFVLFLITICLSLVNVYLAKDSILLLLKQAVGILVNSIFFYQLIKFNKKDIRGLFVVYLNVAFFVGLIGIVQEISYLLKFQPLYDLRYIFPKWNFTVPTNPYFLRVSSIMPEPASFCFAMMPAFFIAVHSFWKREFEFVNSIKCLFIIISFLLSFSSVGYIGLLITLILLSITHLRVRSTLISFAILSLVASFFYYRISDLNLRISQTFEVLTGQKKFDVTNLSTYTLFCNASVAYSAFKDSFIFGNGLGSCELSYERFIDQVRDVSNNALLLNAKDANSLFFRILSELGLFGLLLFFVFILMHFIRKKEDNTNFLWVINNAILVLFMMRLMRQGHYFSEGFFFFLWLYYFTKKVQMEKIHQATKSE